MSSSSGARQGLLERRGSEPSNARVHGDLPATVPAKHSAYAQQLLAAASEGLEPLSAGSKERQGSWCLQLSVSPQLQQQFRTCHQLASFPPAAQDQLDCSSDSPGAALSQCLRFKSQQCVEGMPQSQVRRQTVLTMMTIRSRLQACGDCAHLSPSVQLLEYSWSTNLLSHQPSDCNPPKAINYWCPSFAKWNESDKLSSCLTLLLSVGVESERAVGRRRASARVGCSVTAACSTCTAAASCSGDSLARANEKGATSIPLEAASIPFLPPPAHKACQAAAAD